MGDDLRYRYGRNTVWPGGFPKRCEREAEQGGTHRHGLRASAAARTCRDRVLFTIDGINARDFDDAVGIEQLRRRHHAPDRCHRGCGPCGEAGHRPGHGGQGQVLQRLLSRGLPSPCCPRCSATDAMSLKPDEERLAVAVEIVLGPRGRWSSRTGSSRPSIRSRARLTYEEVGPFLEGTEGPRDV
ncbi:MAG: hypothetical protein MZV70_72955 [Desulfobacterales bacterium]|nr:hypothetical protein [Desulfobacterales bacterium]